MAIPHPHERPHPEAPSPKEFFIAGRDGKFDKISNWLDKKVVDPNEIRDAKGMTLLHYAATWPTGRRLAGTLLLGGANAGVQDKEG